MARENFDGLHVWGKPGLSGYLVSLMQPNKPDRPNRPNEQDRLANEQHFYSKGSPFPFSGGPQTPSDHARALHGIASINTMRDTCLAAKGYSVE